MDANALTTRGEDGTELNEPVFYCVRQRAGPLVKECRALRLALFGFEGSVYSLTFDEGHLPPKFTDARRCWRSFLRRLNLWKPAWSRDYVYLIEGRHGGHRYHIHLVLRDSDFSPAEVRYLWRFGDNVDDGPLLKSPYDSYRRTAAYFNKEATDGVSIPISARTWVASRHLNRQLPPPEVWRDPSGGIEIPDDVLVSGRNHVENQFGAYSYGWFIQKKNSALYLD